MAGQGRASRAGRLRGKELKTIKKKKKKTQQQKPKLIRNWELAGHCVHSRRPSHVKGMESQVHSPPENGSCGRCM